MISGRRGDIPSAVRPHPSAGVRCRPLADGQSKQPGRTADGQRTDNADGQRTDSGRMRTDGGRTADGQRTDITARTADGQRTDGGRTSWTADGQRTDSGRTADGHIDKVYLALSRNAMPFKLLNERGGSGRIQRYSRLPFKKPEIINYREKR